MARKAISGNRYHHGGVAPFEIVNGLFRPNADALTTLRPDQVLKAVKYSGSIHFIDKDTLYINEQDQHLAVLTIPDANSARQNNNHLLFCKVGKQSFTCNNLRTSTPTRGHELNYTRPTDDGAAEDR